MKNFLLYAPVLWWLVLFDLAIALTAANRFDGPQRFVTCAATGIVALSAGAALVMKLTTRFPLGNVG